MYGDGIGTLNVYVDYFSNRRLVWSSTENGVLQEKKWKMATLNNNIIKLPVGGSYYKVSNFVTCIGGSSYTVSNFVTCINYC